MTTSSQTGRFDPAVLQAPVFAAFRDAAARLGPGPAMPAHEDVDRALAELAGVRFVAPLRPRRRGAPVDAAELYDARIVQRGEVPTRPGWHDLANALVWTRFPRAKRALHARQLRAITARLSPRATTLPGARTDEQDALAMLDEGGLVVSSRAAMPRDGDELAALLRAGSVTAHVSATRCSSTSRRAGRGTSSPRSRGCGATTSTRRSRSGWRRTNSPERGPILAARGCRRRVRSRNLLYAGHDRHHCSGTEWPMRPRRRGSRR